MVIVTHDDFKSFVEGAGIAFQSMGIAPARARIEQQLPQKLAAVSVFKKLDVTKEFFFPMLAGWCDTSKDALHKISMEHGGLSFVVTGTLGAYFVPSLCKLFNAKFSVVHFTPLPSCLLTRVTCDIGALHALPPHV
jgi:hypothetical protein